MDATTVTPMNEIAQYITPVNSMATSKVDVLLGFPSIDCPEDYSFIEFTDQAGMS